MMASATSLNEVFSCGCSRTGELFTLLAPPWTGLRVGSGLRYAGLSAAVVGRKLPLTSLRNPSTLVLLLPFLDAGDFPVGELSCWS